MKKYEITLAKRRKAAAMKKEIRKHSASISIFAAALILLVFGSTMITNNVASKSKAAEKEICATHDWTYNKVTVPTCTEDGICQATCMNCGMEKTTRVEATGHETIHRTLGTNDKGETATYVRCNKCGAENTFYN